MNNSRSANAVAALATAFQALGIDTVHCFDLSNLGQPPRYARIDVPPAAPVDVLSKLLEAEPGSYYIYPLPE